MATIHPFRALRPKEPFASRIAAVPYDVVSTDEARLRAAGDELSFLHVSRAEIDLPPGTDPYSDVVYRAAADRFQRLRRMFIQESQPALYCYRLQMGRHEQTGLAASFSLDEYDRDVIKKHERTRRDKEDDRTRHIVELGAQTGPVFLTYRASADVDALAKRVTGTQPLYDFVADDGVAHTIWRAWGADAIGLEEAFRRIPCVYIADGHHRAASAARARAHALALTSAGAGSSSDGEADWMLGVAFPDNQVQILAYNRVVKDLGELSPEDLVAKIGQTFEIRPGDGAPATRGEVGMYVGAHWHTIVLSPKGDKRDLIAGLDVSLLQDGILDPILGIRDVRTDKRIDFVGGARGTRELERRVQDGSAAVAFALFPVPVDDLMKISDAGGIMPPKSTWFEPKLRDGLLIHVI